MRPYLRLDAMHVIRTLYCFNDYISAFYNSPKQKMQRKRDFPNSNIGNTTHSKYYFVHGNSQNIISHGKSASWTRKSVSPDIAVFLLVLKPLFQGGTVALSDASS